jgi:hypothetical protein
MEYGNNDYKWKLWKKKLSGGFQQLLSGAFTSPHCSKALEFTVLAPIWTTNPAKPFLAPIFFIYINHSSHVPFFLSLSTPIQPKSISKLLKKINFIFDFSPILKLHFWFLYFFHIHFLGPIMHNLTKSHGFKFVFWSSRIQNKQPLFTVYPLYIS